MQVIMVDPPSGWRYGFPKSVPIDFNFEKKNLNEWLVKHGYPQAEIDTCGDHFFCRYWVHDEECETK